MEHETWIIEEFPKRTSAKGALFLYMRRLSVEESKPTVLIFTKRQRAYSTARCLFIDYEKQMFKPLQGLLKLTLTDPCLSQYFQV